MRGGSIKGDILWSTVCIGEFGSEVVKRDSNFFFRQLVALNHFGLPKSASKSSIECLSEGGGVTDSILTHLMDCSPCPPESGDFALCILGGFDLLMIGGHGQGIFIDGRNVLCKVAVLRAKK